MLNPPAASSLLSRIEALRSAIVLPRLSDAPSEIVRTRGTKMPDASSRGPAGVRGRYKGGGRAPELPQDEFGGA